MTACASSTSGTRTATGSTSSANSWTVPADEHRKFRVSRSLRDVEPEVQLFLKELES